MQLELYCGLGFHLFPVRKETKRPCIKDNLNKASTDIDQIKAWEKKFPGCYWGLSLAKSGLVAVDVDHKHGGMEAWAALIHLHSEPKTLHARSASGGLHYVFRADKALKYRGKIQDGIDIKYNGYVLVEPSQGYEWRNWTTPKSAPEWLVDLIKKDTRSGKANPVYRFGHNYLDKLVAQLKEYELSYEEWVQAGMALHAASDGDHEGLARYLELSQGASYNEGDLEIAENKWESFSNREDGISSLTLGYLIRKKGGVVPNPQYEEDIKAFKEAKIADIEAEIEEDGEEAFAIRGENLVCWKQSKIVSHFNKKGFAILKNGGKAPFVKLRRKESGFIEAITMGEKALYDFTAPYFFAKYRETATDVKVELSPAYKEWATSINRKEYDRMVFKPNDKVKPGELNLWGELKLEPKYHEEPTLILDFIFKSLCNEDERKFNWLLDWLAHIIQKPWERSTIVPVLISDQGAGKGLLMDTIMRTILEEYYTVVETSAELMEKFNVKLSKKFLTFIDEATWRGNKTEDGRLKRLTGSPTITVEEKFGAKYDLENYSRYLIASNNEEAVALEAGNRRYVVIEASKKYANDLSYFGPIAETIKGEKRSIQAFYGFLLSRDISEFDPHAILKGNTSGKAAKINTSGAVAQFWEDVFFERPRKLWHRGGFLDCRETYNEFLRFCGEIRTYEKSVTQSGFWNKSNRLIPGLPAPTRKRWGENSERIRVRKVDVTLVCQKFCSNLCIVEPEDFDENEYYADSYFDDEGWEDLS